MSEINYTFIIPHKNGPELLQRCVNSIPERSDIQIIVVDDNSDGGKKPSISRDGGEVILLDANQTNGAGHARNVGLQAAKGKWLLFADSDDYYIDGFIDVLDSYCSEDIDVLYFNALLLGVDGKEKVGSRINKVIERYDGSKDALDLVKYRIHAPWNKMIRHSYVESYGFRFEEVPRGNDTMFTYQVGYFSNRVRVLKDKLYVYTVNSVSISHKRLSAKLCLATLCNIYKNESFNSYIGHVEWNEEISLKRYVFLLIKHLRIIDALSLILVDITEKKRISESKYKYVNLIKTIEKNTNGILR